MPSAMSAEEWSRVLPRLRRGAFFSARVEEAKLLDGLRQFVDAAIAEGWSTQQFLNATRKWLRETRDDLGIPYGGEAERRETMNEGELWAYENSVRNIDSIARLKLILRTQTENAAGYRQFQDDFTPDELYIRPGWRFVRRPGAKTFRADHVEHENEVRLKTDTAYWLARNDPSFGGFGNPYGPWGYNSWMWTEPVSRAECIALGLLAQGENPAPAARMRTEWGAPKFVDRSLGERTTPGLAPDVRRALMERCKRAGIQVDYDPATGKLKATL